MMSDEQKMAQMSRSKESIGARYMNTRQTLTFAIAAVILPPCSRSERPPKEQALRWVCIISQAVQPAAHGATKTSQESTAKPVMSKPLPDLPGKEVVIMTVTYPPGHAGAVHRHN